MFTTFTLTGTLIDHTSTQGLPSFEVQIWLTKAGTNATFATATTTDPAGQVTAKFNHWAKGWHRTD